MVSIILQGADGSSFFFIYLFILLVQRPHQVSEAEGENSRLSFWSSFLTVMRED